MSGLTFFTPIAYDYEMAFQAIAAYYDIADEILLGIDAARLSWMKQPFALDEAKLTAFLERIDARRIVKILQGDFHQFDNPMKNDRYEREVCIQQANPKNWVVCIDSDEVICTPQALRRFLLETPPEEGTGVYGTFMVVFKAFGPNDILSAEPGEAMPIAARYGDLHRNLGSPPKQVYAPGFFGVHWAWGRTPEQMWQKLTNWGHACDFDTAKYFDFWSGVTLENYRDVHDFHPIEPAAWSSLKHIKYTRVPGDRP